MTSPTDNTIKFSQEEIIAAQNAEQADFLQVQNEHLTRRVVTLRALVNRLQAQLLEAQSVAEESENDEPQP